MMMKNSFIVSVLACVGMAFAQTNQPAVVAAAAEHPTFDASKTAKVDLGGDLQFRYTWNANKDNFTSEHNNGFNLPLARLRASGNLTDGIDFKLQGAFDDQANKATLQDAYAGFKVFEHSRLQVGQFKLPFMAEVNIGDENTLAADRSVVSYLFGQKRSQGVQFGCGGDSIAFKAAFSDGFDTANTYFTSSKESDYAVTARIDWALAGKVGDAKNFFSAKDQPGTFVVGGAGHYQDGDSQDALFAYTADVSWKTHGFNFFAAGVGQMITDTVDFTDYGVVAQAGYMVTETIEPFVRGESVIPDSDRGFAKDYYNLATVGFNYYIYGQAAKFTLDGVYAFDATNEIATMGDFSHSSLLASSEANEISLRAQFQIKF